MTTPKQVALTNPYIGVETVGWHEPQFRVTTIGRTMVDIVHKPEVVGNWELIWQCLESVKFLEFYLTLEYTKLLNTATTAAKIAFFLDQNRERYRLAEENIALFDPLKPKSPHYLDRHCREPMRLIKRWNLIVPESLIHRKQEKSHGNN